MKDLLYKEYRLCMQPIVYIFFGFVLMLLIPSYPYTIPCFFIGNAIFNSFQVSVGNNDSLFTAMLPIAKKDVVKAKLFFIISIQLIMLLLYVPMIALNNALYDGCNNAGIDACPALIGSCFVLFGLFNVTFLPCFYKTGYRTGRAFLISTIVVFAWIVLSEGFFIAARAAMDQAPLFNWIETHIDCRAETGAQWCAQLIYTAVGALIWAALSSAALVRSAKAFEKVDV
ncbi:MAG: ABC-2 transporter permease [Clostridia bacterium]|nr:ABC-2 transporter permease [Clostridia bacterium]